MNSNTCYPDGEIVCTPHPYPYNHGTYILPIFDGNTCFFFNNFKFATVVDLNKDLKSIYDFTTIHTTISSSLGKP